MCHEYPKRLHIPLACINYTVTIHSLHSRTDATAGIAIVSTLAYEWWTGTLPTLPRQGPRATAFWQTHDYRRTFTVRICTLTMQAAEVLARGHGVVAAHADAIRAVPDTETIAACLGGVKMSAPGLQAAKAAAKKGKKSGK